MTLGRKVCLLLFGVVISISSIKAQEIKCPPLPDSDIKRKHCHSNNDPHMISFSGFNFEFQNIGKYCLANGNDFAVEAQFARCPHPWNTATCNCAVRVDLAGSNNYAEINFCEQNDPAVGTVKFLDIQIECEHVSATFNPLNENEWTIVSTGGPGFKCIYNGQTWIKSELQNPNDNVFVGITVDPHFPGQLNSLEVVVPEDMKSKGCDCLCDADKRSIENNQITILTEEQENQVQEIIPKCEAVLLGELVANLNDAKLVNDEVQQKFNRIARNCAIDFVINNGNIDIGLFQMGVMRIEICLLALKSKNGIELLKLRMESTDECVKQLTTR